jgi:peptidoglycan hydrolase-like protein with peptidoglycan-binding domain
LPAGSGLLVVRGKHVVVVAGGQRYRLTVGGTWSKPAFIGARGGAGLEPDAADEAPVQPLLIPCVHASALGSPGFTIKRPILRFWDPVAGRVYSTGARLAGPVAVAAKAIAPRLHAVPGLDPTIETRRNVCYGHSPAAVDALRGLSEDAWPLLFVDGAQRLRKAAGPNKALSRKDGFDVAGPTTRLTAAGGLRWLRGVATVYPRLTPCVKLTPAQRDALEKQLAAEYAAHGGETFVRVKHGRSALCWVSLHRGSEWTLDGAVVRPDPDSKREALRVYRFIHPRGRGGLAKKKGYDSTLVLLQRDDAIELKIVESFAGKGAGAIIEVRFAVDTLADNEDARARWDRADAIYRELETKLAGDELVDLPAAEADVTAEDRADDPRFRFRELFAAVFARMGRLEPGKADRGLHVQTFCGENIIPAGVAAGGWRVVEADAETSPGSPGFVKAALDAVLADDVLKGRRPAALRRGLPPTPQEWLQLCGDEGVARALSRVIAIHRTEWSYDLDAHAADDPTRLYEVSVRKLGSPDRVPVFPGSEELPGLSGNVFAFYHPLRLVEWLTTGVNLHVSQLSQETADKLAVGVDLGGQHFPLERRGDRSAAMFRFRALLGDAVGGGSRRPTLVVKNLREDGEDLRVPVDVEPGRVASLWLTEPSVQIRFEHQRIGIKTVVAVRDGTDHARADADPETVYLLADGNRKLTGAGPSYGLVSTTVRFNRGPVPDGSDQPVLPDIPDTVKVDLDGDGFEFGDFTVSGVGVDPPAGGWSSARSHTIAARVPGTRAPFGASAASYVMGCPVLGPAKVDASAELTLTVSGGPFASDRTRTLKLATRVIAPGDQGDDVAKLQLYLSQIFAGATPCLAPGRKAARVDGDYGDATGRALWRFALHLWTEDWPALSATGGEPEPRLTHPVGDALEKDVERYRMQYGDLKVTQGLLDLIVEHYAMPHALPKCGLAVEAPANLPFDAALWDAFSDKEKTLVLPSAASYGALLVAVELDGQMAGDPGGVAVKVVLQGQTGLRLLSPADTTLGALLQHGLRVIEAGVVARGGAIALVGAGATVIGSLAVGGAPDLRQGGGNGAAVARLQQHLADAAYFGGKVDGKVGKGTRDALAAYAKDHDVEGDYVETVAHLVTGGMCLVEAAE